MLMAFTGFTRPTMSTGRSSLHYHLQSPTPVTLVRRSRLHDIHMSTYCHNNNDFKSWHKANNFRELKLLGSMWLIYPPKTMKSKINFDRVWTENLMTDEILWSVMPCKLTILPAPHLVNIKIFKVWHRASKFRGWGVIQFHQPSIRIWLYL